MSTPLLPPLGQTRFHGGPWPLLALRRGWKALVVCSVLAGLAWAFWRSSGLAHTGDGGHLSRYGLRTVAVFVAAVVLWVTEAVPLVVTGIGVFTALVLCGFDLDAAVAKQYGLVRFTPQQVANWFGDRVVYFLLGVFLVAGSLSASHVVDHLALRLLNLLGTGPRRLRQGVFWTAFFSAWLMSEHAVAAMLFPVVARIRDALGRPKASSSYVGGLFLALAWGATIGGITTYLGGARIALAMGIAAAKGVGDIPSFTGLMLHSLPIALPFGLVAAVVLELAYPVDVASVAPARHALAERRRELGRFGPRQQAVSLILAATIAAWAWFGVSYLAPVALASAALLLGTGLVRWREVQEHVPWDLLLMEAGALALCQALETTGAATWAAHQAFAALGGATPLVVVAIVTVATIILTELFSNPAVVTLLVPLLVASAAQLGVTPIHLVLAVALPCGLSFVLPLGSPPLAIAFASGELTMRRIASWGLVLDALAVPLVLAAYWLVWRVL
jgi:sodium-dependent dicarboxylate transporter 2/3/5